MVSTLLVDSIPGVNLGIRAEAMRRAQSARLEYLAIAYAAFSTILILLCGAAGPDVSPQLRRSLMEKWTDFFASEDPVPGGTHLVDPNRVRARHVRGRRDVRVDRVRAPWTRCRLVRRGPVGLGERQGRLGASVLCLEPRPSRNGVQ